MRNKKKSKLLTWVFLIATLVMIALTIGLNLSTIKEYFGGESPQNSNVDIAAEQAREAAKNQGLLILVNKQHPVDKSYKPDDLAAMSYYAPDRDAAGRFMREAAAAAFSQLVEGAAKDSVELKMTTAFRSYEFQKILYNNNVNQYGEEAANRFSAKPGQSEHQTGLAVDVSSPSVDYRLTKELGETTEGKWLVSHAYEFGFILRYPEGKEDLTGYVYEPWHLRYVGLFVAKEIYEQGVTLEEYLLKYDLMDDIE